MGREALLCPAGFERSIIAFFSLCRLAFGTLYPAYASYKAVKTKNVKEYVKWMMYWIVFAIFSTAETITDMFLSWFPFYFELKIAFVVWLLSPYTKGSSVLYRKFVHPTLSNKEKEIDEYITQAKDRSYDTMMRFGRRGLNIAASAAGQGVLSEKLRSFSMQDLTLIQNEDELLLDGADDTHAAATLPRAKTATRAGNTANRRASAFLQTARCMQVKTGGDCPSERKMSELSLFPSVRSATISSDTESQHSTRSDDQSDCRTEHSDEDAADKGTKRTTSARAAKKPAAAKTETTTKTVKKPTKKKTTTTANSNPETP
ncbi:hypothetical protein DNTS_014659 [Danionella cerebrum]|uniref:Receptor expression-enhancing protein n=1 Tax=Danionella cerebrum TaxID=2873325 RepID=A0A553Q1Y5_9TELE|nr:hypothetical protein DNTS_014659 [Danionella translucida]